MSVIERLLGREHGVADPLGDLTFDRMRKRDLRDGVLETERHAYPTPWSPNVFQSEIDQMRTGSRHYVVARRDGAIVGHAGLWFTSEEAHVTNIAVHPASRRTHVATRLMLVLADEVIRRGSAAWTLEVRTSSTGAQALYRRFGFAPAGVRTRYYENTEDAIVMWCHDVQDDEYRARLDRIREPWA